jgi:hypothetical protein
MSKKQATLFYGAHARSIAVPAEAITAPVDDIEITLAVDSDNPGEIHWQGRLVVYLNTNLTSPIEDGFSIAKLTVLETELGTGRRVKVSKVFGGQRGANSVSFEVAVRFSQSPFDARLLISDLFANANQLGISLAGPTYIVALVALVSAETDRFDLRAGNVQCQVGKLLPVLDIRGLSPVEHCHPPALPAPDEGAKFRRGVFKLAVAGLPEKTLTSFVSRGRVISRTSFQNGLRVMLRVSGLQEGQELWMLAVVPADILGYTWRYIDADANGGGQRKEPRSAVRLLGLESFRVVPHSEGYACGVYELCADADAPTSYSPQMGSFEFLVCQASTSTMQKSQLIISCCFAPLSTETTASTSAYLPRFADTSSQRAITFEWS